MACHGIGRLHLSVESRAAANVAAKVEKLVSWNTDPQGQTFTYTCMHILMTATSITFLMSRFFSLREMYAYCRALCTRRTAML
jgi:hypothetical protein